MSLKTLGPQMNAKFDDCAASTTSFFVIRPVSSAHDASGSDRICVTLNLESFFCNSSKLSRNQMSVSFLLKKNKLIESLEMKTYFDKTEELSMILNLHLCRTTFKKVLN